MDDEPANTDTICTPLELKFASEGATGEFSGYGAIFGNTDSHGDVIQPGAFAASLAERKAVGRTLPMHVMHRVFGGDGVPVGVWKSIAEDAKGLRVEGKISGMNTDGGRLLFERIKDGALGGLSIGYRVRDQGAIHGKKPGEPKRILTGLHLREISLVDDPSNPLSRVDSVKSVTSKAELEDLLHTAGLSRAAARKIAAGGYAGLTKTTEPEIDLEKIASWLDAKRMDLKKWKGPVKC